VTITRLNEILRIHGVAINTIEFGNRTDQENVFGDWVSVTFGAPGDELTAAHTLLRAPVAIAATRLNTAGDMYFSSAPTSSNVF
jgi:hypothetical protein